LGIADSDGSGIGVTTVDNQLHIRHAAEFQISAEIHRNNERQNGLPLVYDLLDPGIRTNITGQAEITGRSKTANEFAAFVRAILVPYHQRNIIDIQA
jgi:hypothetical protein